MTALDLPIVLGRSRRHQQLQKPDRVLWGVFLKAVDKPYSCTLIYDRPPVQMTAILLNLASQTVIWDLFHIDSYF